MLYHWGIGAGDTLEGAYLVIQRQASTPLQTFGRRFNDAEL
jgi:hypothetical protein